MRLIKFKAWHKKEKKMFDVRALHFTAKERANFLHEVVVDDVKNGRNRVLRHNEVVLLEFTGMNDKNGKEICEGDAVKFFDKLIVAREQADEDELRLLEKIFEDYKPLVEHASIGIVEKVSYGFYIRFKNDQCISIGRFAENDLEVI